MGITTTSMTELDLFTKAIETLNKVKNTNIKIFTLGKHGGDGVDAALHFHKDNYGRSLHFSSAWFDPNEFDLVIVRDKLKLAGNETNEEKIIIKLMCYIYYWAKREGHI